MIDNGQSNAQAEREELVELRKRNIILQTNLEAKKNQLSDISDALSHLFSMFEVESISDLHSSVAELNDRMDDIFDEFRSLESSMEEKVDGEYLDMEIKCALNSRLEEIADSVKVAISVVNTRMDVLEDVFYHNTNKVTEKQGWLSKVAANCKRMANSSLAWINGLTTRS